MSSPAKLSRPGQSGTNGLPLWPVATITVAARNCPCAVSSRQPSSSRSIRSTLLSTRTSSRSASAYSRKYARRSSRATQRPYCRGIRRPGRLDSRRGVCSRRRSYRSRQAAPGSGPASSSSGSSPARRSRAPVASPADPAPTITTSRVSTGWSYHPGAPDSRGPAFTIRMRAEAKRERLIRPAHRDGGRPLPDEAELGEEPTPQPERTEPSLESPRLRDFSLADWKAIVIRAGKEFLAGNVMPGQATSLLKGSLKNLDAHPASSIVMTVGGFVLAVWSTTGAMTAYMTAINLAYNRKDRRTFVRKRVVALKMASVIGAAFALVAVLLIFGPQIEKLISSHVGPVGGVIDVAWWVAQWPVLLIGLLVAFATLLFFLMVRRPPR